MCLAQTGVIGALGVLFAYASYLNWNKRVCNISNAAITAVIAFWCFAIATLTILSR